VPLAALKLKQGFGRLIRSRTDVGVVVLLDRRVMSRRYGGALLAGLPPATRRTGPWAVLREEMAEFFALHGIGEAPEEAGEEVRSEE
jgi:Rad3-related DNA helicase